MIEFKQIIGRGTRIYDGKFYFTIWDFVQAFKKYSQPDWDGEPVCPKCGNNPCTCKKTKHYPPKGEEDDGAKDQILKLEMFCFLEQEQLEKRL